MSLLTKIGDFVIGDRNDNEATETIEETVDNKVVPESQPVQTANASVNISTGSTVEMMIVKAKTFKETAMPVADHLKAGKTILINFEDTDKEEAKNMIMFFHGNAYILGGNFKKVGDKGSTFVLSPKNVSVMGEENEETSGN